jgi:hypothetical protein
MGTYFSACHISIGEFKLGSLILKEVVRLRPRPKSKLELELEHVIDRLGTWCVMSDIFVYLFGG